MKFHLWPAELREQLDRAMRLEEERRRAELEAARLEAERMEAIIAKEELERKTMDQIRSQEQLVSPGVSTCFYWVSGSFGVNSTEFLLDPDSCLIFWPSLT